ncbi:hypothetical protein HIM_12017 [Hirsutella minnesotensis 3608]|uniref:Serine aminopeptidase S33 domain-containing protein n=1 Tax=Hirsutella minnesotensis 3608 TaxID=1043627 RepID=A0A0F7ZW98_9HYPO|nr:hypothetical protein HIM_12017 [Hirsutella minnesotensis 3608]
MDCCLYLSAGQAAAVAAATAAAWMLARAALWPRQDKVLRGPLHPARRTLMVMSDSNGSAEKSTGGFVVLDTDAEELVGLPHNEDIFPGARDVSTPYGSVRVYEFGPEDGPKVLFVHGITTSCMPFTPLAHALVARGCRVMLFDLFGRGLSDGVGDLPHDARLYSSRICELASSPLSWMGDGAFRLIGYSLGGALALAFANSFPRLVSSLVMLAPAGLIRLDARSTAARVLFSASAVPDRLAASLASFRLRSPIAMSSPSAPPQQRGNHVASDEPVQKAFVAVAAAEAEFASVHRGHFRPDEKNGVGIGSGADADDEDRRRAIALLEDRVSESVSWMIDNHAGFVPAFLSCIRSAPLTDQHDSWRRIARRPAGSTAVLLAEFDDLIDAQLYTRHGLALAGGSGHVVWRVLPGNHDFVMTHSDHIIRELDNLWAMTPPV